MEYYSWTNTGVPEPEAWDMDDELVVIQASQGIGDSLRRRDEVTGAEE